ncbi:MAG: triose-phosphate isomerase [Desulfobacterales bacterium]|nr:MAG: triose-phosphate isomerase [Desulfobacterales bacterium]
MARKPFIAGNWKMYKTGSQAVETARELASLCRDMSDIDIMIAPTALSLPLVAQAVEHTPINVGAQNLYFETQGAYTGEVSAQMVKAAGAQYAIIGHSERRQYFGETDDFVAKKVKAAIEADLIPVVCIGETEAERDAQKTFFVLDKQVTDGLKIAGPDGIGTLILAYEPVWAIGTGKTAGPEQVDEVHQFLRKLLKEKFSETLANETRILYGGSVNPDNIKALMNIEDVDGALVGGASLDAATFSRIIGYRNR